MGASSLRTGSFQKRSKLRGNMLIPLSFVVLVSTIAGAARNASVLEFSQAISGEDDPKALLLGDALFVELQAKYKADVGFRAYEARLTAAEFLAGQMRQQLQKATGSQLLATADKVFGQSEARASVGSFSVAPAKQFYDSSLPIFSKPVNIESLSAQERSFLAQYYNLKLKGLTSAIAKAGQALAIAEPSFQGTYDYTLVLPLLHASQDRPVKTDILPAWTHTPKQLDEFSDSCLFTFEMPFFAMVVAREAARKRSQPFSEIEFYRSASKRCGKQYPHIAADCLGKAIELTPETDADGHVALHFDLIQLWLDSRNYQLAAGEARKVFETYDKHDRSGQAIWLYYYALSRSNDTRQILTDIDQALEDERCTPYTVKLMYIKWWALRRQRDQGARVAALEHELLERYGDDPIVAPILLSQATDLLASQAYGQATGVLSQLAEKFPSTRAAVQARRMLERLKAVGKDM